MKVTRQRPSARRSRGALQAERSCLIIREIARQSLGDRSRNQRTFGELRMIGLDCYLAGRRELQELVLIEASKRETHELHGADAIGCDLPRIEAGRLAAIANADPEMTLETDQRTQCNVALSLVGVLDKHRGGKLARPRKQFVVSVDFVADGVLGGHSLGSHHLLNLIPNGLAVLEQQSEMFANREPAALLFGDNQRAQPRAQNLVLLERENFLQSNGLHYDYSCASAGGS